VYQKSELTLKEALSAFFVVEEYWKEKGTNLLHVIVRTLEAGRETNPNPTLSPLVEAISGFLDFKLVGTYQQGYKKWRLVFETDEPEVVVAYLLEWEDSCKKTLRKYGLLKPTKKEEGDQAG